MSESLCPITCSNRYSHRELLTKVNVFGLEPVFHHLDVRKGSPKLDRPLLHPSFQFVMGFLQCLCDQFPVGDIADVTLNHFMMIDQVDITDKFHGDVPSIFGS